VQLHLHDQRRRGRHRGAGLGGNAVAHVWPLVRFARLEMGNHRRARRRFRRFEERDFPRRGRKRLRLLQSGARRAPARAHLAIRFQQAPAHEFFQRGHRRGIERLAGNRHRHSQDGNFARHVSFRRQGRTEREQGGNRRASDALADRPRRCVAGAAQPGAKRSHRDGHAYRQALCAQAGPGQKRDGAVLRRQGQHLVGQPDSQLRFPTVSHGEGFAHRRTSQRCASRDGRTPRSICERLAPRRLPAQADAGHKRRRGIVMATEKNQEKEFIIPTRYKTQIGYLLSWPVGAMELTKAILNVPQIKELELIFGQHYPTPHQGKWPVSFSVLEVRYAHPLIQLSVPNSDWDFYIYPVPRNMRAEIREALTLRGFKLIADWLLNHAGFSGRESNLRFTGVWNSELKELSFGSRDYVLPEVSTDKQKSKK